MKVPRAMSTQHPDNVNIPFFAESQDMEGDDEIEEAFYAFSHLNCEEQMWDYEGKEVDSFVVKKLLTKYKSFFEEKRLGQDLFLTLRVPNPKFEEAEAKILIETLETIPRSFDASHLVYNDDIAPIFEVILPMCTSERSLNRIYNYYQKFVYGKQNFHAMEGDITLKEWVGGFAPPKINVIPLFEADEYILNSHEITRKYLEDKDPEYQRVFYARSDPALNYGLISAVLINKIAHQRIYRLSEEISINICPIIGVGSAPFRGNLTPKNIERVMDEYPSVQTFTIQSAFKYDYPLEDIYSAIKKLCKTPTKKPHNVDEERCLKVIDKYSKEYSKQVEKLAPYINKISPYIPSRRKRKLHIGLFGYCREVGEFCLPRAISFTACLCSLGLPPSLLGLNCLSQKDYDFIKSQYIYFEEDLKDALKYYNPNQQFLSENIAGKLKEFGIDYELDEDHKGHTDDIIEALKKDRTETISKNILMAANRRKFLG